MDTDTDPVTATDTDTDTHTVTDTVMDTAATAMTENINQFLMNNIRLGE